jgi:hypothetical protein
VLKELATEFSRIKQDANIFHALTLTFPDQPSAIRVKPENRADGHFAARRKLAKTARVSHFFPPQPIQSELPAPDYATQKIALWNELDQQVAW